jgi:hypothetical protein
VPLYLLTLKLRFCAQANRCTQLAAETNNPQLKEQLLELAKKWGLLALDLEGTINC